MNTELATRPATPAQAVLSQSTAIEQARAVAEVQAAVTVAQNVPRVLGTVRAEMLDACSRIALAERAFYRVSNRGEGPSVHLARELARIFGNIDYGVHELRRDDTNHVSEIRAYCWDQERNSRQTRTFIVPHKRMKGRDQVALTDLGDVYLNNQNIGARALRECILSALPSWFVDEAVDACRQTLANGGGVPLDQRITTMISRFREQLHVTQDRIEKRLGKKRAAWGPGDIAEMTIVYQSISRGEATVEDEFPNRVTATEILGQAGDVPAAAVAAESPSADPYDGPMFPQAGESS